MSDGAQDLSAERARADHDATAADVRTPPVGRRSSSNASHPPPKIADRFEIRRELGRGGAAIVWLAHDLVEDRDVAVKVLREEVANTVAAERFLEEIRIDTDLSHPHLLPVLGSGDWDGLLYYVAPFVEAGSLRTRLDREHQLPVGEALAIARDVASALSYAHGRGVIHRDVKPENILIAGDRALVADFGIARALTRASGDRITSTGIAVGTPAYMSPEQAAGNRDLDERTDVYSLACVLYEMLAGVPPFIGPTPESVIAQRFLHPPHPLRSYRPAISPEVERAIVTAMAIAPADRQRTMQAFVDALALAPSPGSLDRGHDDSRSRRRWLILGAGAVAALAGAVAMSVSSRVDRAGISPADSTRYLIAPVSVAGTGMRPDDARERMAGAIGRWRDIVVVGAATRSDEAALWQSGRGSSELASRAGAGRIVVARLATVGDSLELTASVRPASGGSLREYTARAPSRDSMRVARLFVAAGAALVAAGTVGEGSGEWLDDAMGTQRAAAWRAYARGRTALDEWHLAPAIRDLRAAVDRDPQYAQAQLWLAQALAWSRPDHADEWQGDALRAGSLASRLSRADSIFAVALAHLAAGRYPEACALYRGAIGSTSHDDVAWLGLAQCQAMDDAVVRDRKSPSGWRFRGSYHSAALAYDSAVARASGAPGFAFTQYGRILFVEPFRVRRGRALSPDSSTFLAHPSTSADTLALVPYPAAEIEAAAPRTLPPTLATTLAKNAERLAARFEEWVNRAPGSGDALSALAYVQEVRADFEPGDEGNLAALNTLRAAVRANPDPEQRTWLATSIVRVLLKGERYAMAHDVADSLLAANSDPSPARAILLAGVAALIGDVGRTERLLSLTASDPSARAIVPVPHPVAVAAARLTADAALGVCSPRLSTLVKSAESQIERYVAPDRREIVRTHVLARPLSLAFPCLGAEALEAVRGQGSRLMQMQRALARGDRRAVHAHFDTLARMRRVDRVGDIALDNTFQEAWLLLSMGDTSKAQRQLCVPLSALPTLGSRLLFDAPQAAAIGRSLALCAQVAARRGDAVAARRWAGAVGLLWATADSSLTPLLAELRPLVESKH